jgi:UDPglucose 6-dehydrogenase
LGSGGALLNVCVFGLWHLGAVTAACLASLGHQVVGLDDNEQIVDGLQAGRLPLFEPGLEELIAKGLHSGRLCFSSNSAAALRDADIVWVAFDTPVDDEDKADTAFVINRIIGLFPHLRDGATVIVSSQLPVGSTRALQATFAERERARQVAFAYSPENLRLGKALSIFLTPDRIVVGVANDTTRTTLEPFLHSITEQIVWMGLESAEMTKHAINAFLATSITFANEIATICEVVGADAREVARGLKSESRIGIGAYVSPGGPFAGGTLARDVSFLTAIGGLHGLRLDVLGAVRPSNDRHRHWTQDALARRLPNLQGKIVALLGLAYKSGTDTLRRSASVELARWLVAQGARIAAFDPRLTILPDGMRDAIELRSSAEEALANADAAIISFDDAAFRSVDWPSALATMASPFVVDPVGMLRDKVKTFRAVDYVAVGFANNQKQDHVG